jgi:hypothetical protein
MLTCQKMIAFIKNSYSIDNFMYNNTVSKLNVSLMASATQRTTESRCIFRSEFWESMNAYARN